MKNKTLHQFFVWLLSGTFLLFSIVLVPGFFNPANAFLFEMGELQGSLDTTISYGLKWRVQDQDQSLIGLMNGGQAFSVNGDNGNLNFDEGLVSNTPKITSDLELNYKSFGAFVRGTAFYDFEVEDRNMDKMELSDDALELVGSDARILDAYLYGGFDIAGRPVDIRVGDQVVSWGEGTFFQGGINTINPVNVSAIRVPGSELKEALVPEGMVYASVGVTSNLAFEGLYLYDWDNTDVDPPGSYFSTSDAAGEGGSKVYLGFGSVSDEGTDLGPMGFNPDFLAVTRGPDGKADDDGQYGIALRYFAEALNDTEFGLFYVNYHSRVPILSLQTGSAMGVAAASAANFQQTVGGLVQQLMGAGMDQATATATAAAQAAPLLIDAYSQTGSYFTEYPEDIQMVGLSFNTSLGSTGIALQGEVAYRKDLPLQIDDVELVLAYLSPIEFNPAYKDNQVSQYFDTALGADEVVHGFIEKDVYQASLTATQVLGPTAGADALTLLCEVGYTRVEDMPATSELRLESAGTYTSGNKAQVVGPGMDPFKPFGGAHAGKAAENAKYFADADSWGYRCMAKLTYNDALGPIGLAPRVAWQHDVSGNSPGPGGNFIEDRKAITFGVTGTYLSAWSMDVSYTNYFGADRHNLINDRDFVQANVKYSF